MTGFQYLEALRTNTSRNVWSIYLGCMLLASCSIVSGPNDYGLPDPDLSLDPAALSEPSGLYACGKWIGAQPTEEKIFVDVSFLRPDLDAEPIDRPSARHLAALKKHGGSVAYTFHFPVVRALIATNDVPGLAADPAVIMVFRVGNLRRYDWYVNVGYRSRSGYTAGIIKYGELGGRVDYRFDVINAIGGLISDRSARNLRADPETEVVESSSPFANCGS